MSAHEPSEGNLTNELLQALLSATAEQKRLALRVLKGDAEELQETKAVEPLLTLRDVARKLNVSACSLWRWEIPGHQMGGRRRFRMSEVLAYLESDEFKERSAELKEERKLQRKSQA